MYNIGEKVIIKGWQHTGKRDTGLLSFVYEMDKFIGQEATISDIQKFFGIYPVYTLENITYDNGLRYWKFVDEWLELVEENIEINIDDKDFEAILV